MIKKSPLKNKPLRSPGQSIEKEIQKIIDDGLTNYLIYPILFFAITAYSWLVWLQVIEITKPIPLTVLTAWSQT